MAKQLLATNCKGNDVPCGLVVATGCAHNVYQQNPGHMYILIQKYRSLPCLETQAHGLVNKYIQCLDWSDKCILLTLNRICTTLTNQVALFAVNKSSIHRLGGVYFYIQRR